MALIVKRSRLPGAGKGLFTTKPYKKDQVVIEYRGEIIQWKEYRERVAANKDGYLLFISRKKCVDAYSTPQYKARYANDAMGISRVKGVRNNCQYEIHGDRGYIVTTRDIKAGEEIYVDYTKQYWDVMRHNIKLAEEKKKEKSGKQRRKDKKKGSAKRKR